MKKISGFLDREDFVCPVRCVLFQTVDLEKEDIKIMRKNNLFKKTVAAGLVLLMTASLAACDGKKTDTKTEDKKTETKADKEEDVELQVFIAASLNTAMTKKDMSVTCSSLQHRNRWISLRLTDW